MIKVDHKQKAQARASEQKPVWEYVYKFIFLLSFHHLTFHH
jgi:hypothetical protein